MKSNIFIDLASIVRAGLINQIDLIDWAIIDYINGKFSSEEVKKISKYNRKYVLVNYPQLLEDLLIIDIKTTVGLSGRFAKLRALGLIESFQLPSGALYVSFTNLTNSLVLDSGRIEGTLRVEQTIKQVFNGLAVSILEVLNNSLIGLDIDKQIKLRLNRKFNKGLLWQIEETIKHVFNRLIYININKNKNKNKNESSLFRKANEREVTRNKLGEWGAVITTDQKLKTINTAQYFVEESRKLLILVAKVPSTYFRVGTGRYWFKNQLGVAQTLLQENSVEYWLEVLKWCLSSGDRFQKAIRNIKCLPNHVIAFEAAKTTGETAEEVIKKYGLR